MVVHLFGQTLEKHPTHTAEAEEGLSCFSNIYLGREKNQQRVKYSLMEQKQADGPPVVGRLIIPLVIDI